MIRLRMGYFISGSITGLILLVSFLTSLPDGRLHITVCDVGQGDAIYIRLPDNRDMLIDGGPNSKVIDCLSKVMPFWDRTIDIVAITHSQKDHIGGLSEVLKRYKITYFLTSGIFGNSEGEKELLKLIENKKVTKKIVATGDIFTAKDAHVFVLWPEKNVYASSVVSPSSVASVISAKAGIQSVLSSSFNLNDTCLVLQLRYGKFDAVFAGDADEQTNTRISVSRPADGVIELLKVPHHGAKAALSDAFLTSLFPSLKRTDLLRLNCQTGMRAGSCFPVAVISVGKNSYGHPAPELLSQLEKAGVKILRTDQSGNITITSDGNTWSVKTEK